MQAERTCAWWDKTTFQQATLPHADHDKRHGSTLGTVPYNLSGIRRSYRGMKLVFAFRPSIHAAISLDAFSTSFRETNSTGVCM